MTDPREALRQYAHEDAPQADPTIDPVPLRCDIAPAVFAALEAVLDRHIATGPADGRYCLHDQFDWPCPTVRAITTELTKEN